MKSKRIALLQKIDELLASDRCGECWGAENMNCGCEWSQRLRECGKELNKHLNVRPWEPKLEEIRKKRTLTLNEFMELVNQGVEMKTIAEVLSVNKRRVSDWCNYYGLTRQVRASKKKQEELLARCGKIRFLRSGYNYQKPRRKNNEQRYQTKALSHR